MEILNSKFLGNTLWFWASGAGVAFAVLLLLLSLRMALRGPLGRMLSKLPGKIDDAAVETLSATHGWFLFAVSIYAGSYVLRMPPEPRRYLNLTIIVLLFIQAGRWVQTFVRRAVELWTPESPDAPSRTTLGAAIMFLSNLTVWSVVLLLILQNLGVQIGALIAGLGVGGVAAALAMQAVLKDLIASLSIYLDRPFDIGDSIAVGEFVGVVHHVGLRTTRMIAVGGEHIVLPNGEITAKGIRNYRRLSERRIQTVLRIAYDAPYQAVREVSPTLREIVSSEAVARFDRAHLRSYGDFGMEFELVYYITTPDYRVYMDAQERINLEILRRLEAAGLKFGIPGRPLQPAVPSRVAAEEESG